MTDNMDGPAKVVTVHCAVDCVGGKAPSEADVAEMLRQIELHAVRKGYRGIIETRQYWRPILIAGQPDTEMWAFAIYRDYNVP